MLYTYIRYVSACRLVLTNSDVKLDRWHKGTVYAETLNRPRMEFDDEARTVVEEIEKIKVNRHWGQPYVSIGSFTNSCGNLMSLSIARAVCVRSVYGGPAYERLVRVHAQRVADR